MKLLINENQLQFLIKEEMEIDELRGSHYQYVKNKSKEMTGQEWPEYVLMDWLYKNTKDYGERDTPNSYRKLTETLIRRFINEYGPGEWRYRILDIDIDKFDNETKERILSRRGGEENPYDVPNDSERHHTQLNLIKKQGGPSNEPIIVVQKPDGLELLEGWHRTIQSLKEFGSYKQPSYIYYPKN